MNNPTPPTVPLGELEPSEADSVRDSISVTVAVADEIMRLRTATANALREAVNAIYFNDSSDYLPALWSVVRSLDQDVAGLLESDESAAFYRVNPDAANAPPLLDSSLQRTDR